MDIERFKEDIEKPIFASLEDVFQEAGLNEEEKSVYIKYKKYCKYWLLRAKRNNIDNWGQGGDNFITKLARALIVLDSDRVEGSKTSFVKVMFSDKTVHRVIETKNGVRSTKNSVIVATKFFELDILSYFVFNGFKIFLIESQKSGQKIPEFKAVKDGITINVEAKKLDQDSVMNNIFGDGMIEKIGYKHTKEKLDEGYKRIERQFARNYEDAIGKLSDIENGEYYIIFMYAYYRVDYTGKYLVSYINNLYSDMSSYKNLIGVVIPDTLRTYFLKNITCNIELERYLTEYPIGNYNIFSP